MYYPTARQIIWTVITSLQSHALMRDPPVFYPVKPKKQIKVERWRTYDGIELEEGGLTLSIYPDYSYRTYKTPPTRDESNPSVSFKPFTLGRRTESYRDEATYRFVVQLNYQDLSLNQETLEGVTVAVESPTLTQTSVHTLLLDEGFDPDIELQNTSVEDIRRKLDFKQKTSLLVQINPGEEILRDYLELLRYILASDMYRILPWKINCSRVVLFDFPSSSWLRTNTDIYFHSAYLIWEVTIYAPAVVSYGGKYPYPVEEVIGEIVKPQTQPQTRPSS